MSVKKTKICLTLKELFDTKRIVSKNTEKQEEKKNPFWGFVYLLFYVPLKIFFFLPYIETSPLPEKGAKF
jgi:hypothetical protein